MRLLLPLLFGTACTAATPLPSDPADPTGTATPEHIPSTGGDDSAVTDTDTTPTDTDTTPTETTDPPPEFPKACPDIYDPDTLPVVELSFSDADMAGLAADCRNYRQNYHPVSIVWDGEPVEAMARLKGNWSWSCDKFQFVISWNEVDPAGRFHGVRKTMFDAPWYDHTYLHERTAFSLFEARGLPYSCVNNVKVSINGSYYGLYANVERIDEEYLERHYDEKDGNLYQAGSELKTNEDTADTSRLDALRAATTVEEIGALVHLDQAVAEWATEAMIPALDNYWAGVEINYYLYDHPTWGFEYLPYDMDITFGDSAYPGSGPFTTEAHTFDPITYQHTGWLKEQLLMTVLADTFWCERFVEELAETRAVFDPEAMSAQVATWAEQIDAAAAEDGRAAFSYAEHQTAVASLRGFFQQRADFVDGWLAAGGHCPARW